MKTEKHICPKCGCEKFRVSAHVVQEWIVDSHGNWESTTNDCLEVAHFPDSEDIWECNDCHYSAAGSKFLQEQEDVKVLPVPEDAENDRLWVSGNEIHAVYYNPDGNDGKGLFEKHRFYYLDVLKAYCESKGNKDHFVDLLYGDACKCPTYCIDAGTEAFNKMIEKWDTGIETTPDALVNILVDTALTIEM